eukprot:1515915-Amphidinium_carterae.1
MQFATLTAPLAIVGHVSIGHAEYGMRTACISARLTVCLHPGNHKWATQYGSVNCVRFVDNGIGDTSVGWFAAVASQAINPSF